MRTRSRPCRLPLPQSPNPCVCRVNARPWWSWTKARWYWWKRAATCLPRSCLLSSLRWHNPAKRSVAHKAQTFPHKAALAALFFLGIKNRRFRSPWPAPTRGFSKASNRADQGLDGPTAGLSKPRTAQHVATLRNDFRRIERRVRSIPLMTLAGGAQGTILGWLTNASVQALRVVSPLSVCSGTVPARRQPSA